MSTVLIHCAHPVLRRGLQTILSERLFSIIGISTSIAELEDCLRTASPDLLLVETNPAVGIGVLRGFQSMLRQTSVIVWVDSVHPDFISQCLSSGVRGVLSKSSSAEMHLNCFSEVAAGNLWIEPELSRSLPAGQEVNLTPRERQLMGLLAQGLKNKEIAWALGITEGTVKVYLSRLFVKVGAGDRFDLALIALKNLSGSAERPDVAPRAPGIAPVPFSFPPSIRRPLQTASPIPVFNGMPPATIPVMREVPRMQPC